MGLGIFVPVVGIPLALGLVMVIAWYAHRLAAPAAGQRDDRVELADSPHIGSGGSLTQRNIR
jgi:hypothetical protein